MPSNPAITLGLQMPQVQYPDPSRLYLTLAQIQDMRQQADLRNLQADQMRRTMGDYAAIQAPGGPMQRLQDLSRGTPVNAMPAQVPPSSPLGSGGTPAMPQPGPITQEALPPAGVPSDAAPAPALQAPQGQGALAPGAPNKSEQRRQIYQDMLTQYPYAGPHLVPLMMGLEKQNLEQQQGELKMHADALGMMQQAASTILAQPPQAQPQAYQQTLALFSKWGIPGVEQFPAQFDPQTVQNLATGSRTAEMRITQQQKQLQLEIDAHEAETKRMAEVRTGRKVTVQPTASGIALQQETPQPGTTGTTYMQAPGGGIALPPEQAKLKDYYDAQGRLHLGQESVPPGQTPLVRQPQMVPPGYSAQPGAQPSMPAQLGAPVPPGGQAPGQPGAQLGGQPGIPVQPGAQVPAQVPVPGIATQPPVLMNQEAVQKNLQVGREAQQKQLSDAIQPAENARMTLNALDRIKLLTHQPYYDDLLAKDFSGPDAQKILIGLGRDPQKLANTFEIKNLATQLVIDQQGGRGIKVGPTEIGKLEGAVGRLEQIPPKAAALQAIDELRRLAKQNIQHFNTLAGASNTQGVSQYPTRPTLTQAQFTEVYNDLKQGSPGLTKDDVALRLERRGYDVEGAY